jgi:DNA-binding MarR family transcriptional regulator
MPVTSTVADDRVMTIFKGFRLIFKATKRHYRWLEQQTGVSGAQLWAIAAVVEQPGIRVTELGQLMAVHQSTTSNLVERLVQAGFLRRERSERDQRVVELFPTAKGVRLVRKAPAAVRGVLLDGLEKLGSRDLAALRGALGRLIEAMGVAANESESMES